MTGTHDDIKAVLDSLRWREDMVITNHEGERVWLKPCFNAEGSRIGITDCCFEDDPCEHHKALEGAINVEKTQ